MMSESEPATLLHEATIRVQLNQIDYTLIHPGPLDNSSLPRVPVIRVYGTSSMGKKACIHIHQVYPYFFVEFNGKLNAKYVNRYISKLTQSLNHAIALSLKRNPHSANAQYIRAILLVKVADPAYINRVVTILQSGSVMHTRFQVYESHLSYILQFMCDFGLYGCGWMDLGGAYQRDTRDTDEDLTAGSSGTEAHLPPSPYFRQSRMPLELDAIAPQILNRYRVVARNLHHKLEIPAPPTPSEPLVLSVRELWDDERQRRRARGLDPSPEMPHDPSDSSRGKGGDWVAEARWWEEVRERIEKERAMEAPVKESPSGWEDWVMTTFESIEAVWEPPWKVWKPVRDVIEGGKEGRHVKASHNFLQDLGEDADDTGREIDVDVSMLSSQEINDMIDMEEAERAGMAEDDDQYIDEEGDDENNDVEIDASSDNDSEKLVTNEDKLPDNSDTTRSATQTIPIDITLARTNTVEDPFQESGPILDKSRELQFPSPPRPLSSQSDVPGTPTPYSKKVQEDPASPASSVSGHTTQEELLLGTDTVEFSGVKIISGSQPQRKSDKANNYISLKRSDITESRVDDMKDQPVKKRRLRFSAQNEDILPPNSFFSSPSPSIGIPESNPAVVKIIRPNFDFRTIKTVNLNRYTYAHAPPTILDLTSTLADNNIPDKIYHAPYFSRQDDVPERAREYAGLTYHLKGNDDDIANLQEWDGQNSIQIQSPCQNVATSRFADFAGWEYASSPPSMRLVKTWLASDEGKKLPLPKPKIRSQIEGPTPGNLYGLKGSLATNGSKSSRERQAFTLLSLEVFAPSQEGKVPHTETDEIVAAIYSYQLFEGEIPHNGVIVVESAQFNRYCLHGIPIETVPAELDLINSIADVVVNVDPDILVGWEVERASWGYLDARSRQYGFDVPDLISRAPALHTGGNDQWGMRHTSTFKVAGRHVLNLWRVIRSERTLTSYTFENAVFNILHRRVPRYTNLTLSEWYNDGIPLHSTDILRYFAGRAAMVLEILEKSEVVTKTAEFARVFGVDFFSVLSRGSQFKVESFMFRIAKPESFVLISPSKKDVGKQNAAECMPLIMEPLSAFYSSPLLVLDFQSLYPSIMIAYNYCYSTCLGRVKPFRGKNKFGVVDLDESPGMLEKLSEHIHIAPNGIMYVKPEVRKGLLGRMLVELLETRVMVKHALKGVKNDNALRRILDARQLSLKYISNVTYGYTSATYSGRMPAVEIADSIVQSGRETLEKAITLINETKKWGAQVVYGDTDSIFVYLRGKTKEQAFRIGNRIADAVTAQNPAPVKLKFEKVYLPCVLLAKKRYVGFKYENIDDVDPVFDAKGIETVRRDGVPAQQKMTENTLKILFRTQNLSEVKDYCYRSWTKILENRVSIQDFVFAKEVRMGTYSERVPPPPGVTVAARRMVGDPNSEPQYGERVPYVIARGVPNSRLVDRAMDPLEFLNESHSYLDTTYYISRVLIPPLERIFNLMGADLRQWFSEMPRPRYLDIPSSPTKGNDLVEIPSRLNIDEHFRSSQCLICGEPAIQGLCDACYLAPQETIANLTSQIRSNERRLKNMHRVCATCTGSGLNEEIRCESLDCPWMYSRKRAENKGEFLVAIQEVLDDLSLDDEDGDMETDASLEDEYTTMVIDSGGLEDEIEGHVGSPIFE